MPDQKPTAPPKAPSPNLKEARDKSMWKLLLQLRPFLPYLARLVPMLEMAVGPLQSAGMSSDIRKAVAGSIADSTAKIESIQRDLSAAVTSAFDRQSAQLTRLEDELTRLRQASEKFGAAQADAARDLKSLTRLFQIAALGGAMLLMALIVMAAFLLTHSH